MKKRKEKEQLIKKLKVKFKNNGSSLRINSSQDEIVDKINELVDIVRNLWYGNFPQN